MIVLMTLICLLLCAYAPADLSSPGITTGIFSDSNPSARPTQPIIEPIPSESNTAPVPTESITAPDTMPDPVFANMPQMYSGLFKIFALEKHRFYVLSLYDASYRIYDSRCNLLSENAIPGIEGQIGIVCVCGNMILLSRMNGQIFLFDLVRSTLIKTDLVPGVYQYAGGYGSNFLLASCEQGLICLGFDGKSKMLYKNGSAQVVGSTYAAGIRGGTMLPCCR